MRDDVGSSIKTKRARQRKAEGLTEKLSNEWLQWREAQHINTTRRSTENQPGLTDEADTLMLLGCFPPQKIRHRWWCKGERD
jgi:hypothetical protein